jgi:GNAT superfamily N-acetyltransferase
MPRTEDYSIREATEEDVVDLAILGKQFAKESKNYDLLGWNSTKAYNFLFDAIQREDFGVFCLYTETEIVGMLICFVTPCFFSNVVQAVEIVWYVDPDHRGSRKAREMLDWYEEWAESRQAVCTNLVNLDTLNAGKVAKIYVKRGYRLVENTFVKEL